MSAVGAGASGQLFPIDLIPNGWKSIQVKHVFRIVGGSTPESGTPEHWDGEVVWITPADLSKLADIHISDSERHLSELGLSSCSASLVPSGSIVLSTRAPIGSLGISAVPLSTNQGCKALVPNPGVVARYVTYLLSIGARYLNVLGRGATFLELSGDALGSLVIPQPPEQLQIAISDFLDRETTRIDALIAKKTRFIELLREKRQAIIFRSVTRGLDVNASIKDSGVSWIGGIPAHWDVGRIKAWFRTQSGGTPDTASFDAFYAPDAPNRWIRTLDLANAPLSATELGLTSEGLRASAASLLPVGSVLIAMYGGDGTIGKNALLEIEACTNQAICALLPNDEFDSRYTFRWVQFLRPYWMIDAASTRKDPNISQEQIRNAFVLRPPLVEQRAIARHVDALTCRLDELTACTKRSIELLSERRAALITAAVTGQIDVQQVSADQFPRSEKEPA